MSLSFFVPSSFVSPPRGLRWRRALAWAARLAVVAGVSVGALVTPRSAGAQLRGANSVYAELLGNGGLYSVNFDRRIGAGGASVRVGVGSWETTGGLFFPSDERRRFLTVPVLLNVLTGAGTHHLEAGAGVLLGSQTITRGGDGASERSAIVNATGTAGYRRQPPGGGWVFRAGLTPFYGFGTEEDAYPERGFFLSGGISAGYSF